MKRTILFFFLFFSITTGLLAQPGKKPKSKAATQVQPMQGGVNNEKLDDLKNPFDTNKVRQVQPAGNNFSWGASNPTSQNQRTRPPGISDQKWRDDSLLWIKNGRNPQTDNFSWGASNPTSQGQRTQQAQPGKVNNTKLDDLKNPFDTTKKVAGTQPGNFSWGESNAGAQSGQATGKRQHGPVTVLNRNPDSLTSSHPNTQTQTQGKRQHKPFQKTPVSGNVQANKYANQETNYRTGQAPKSPKQTGHYLDSGFIKKPVTHAPAGARRKKI